MRIAIQGVMGVGKSTFGIALSERLSLPYHKEPFEQSFYIPHYYQDPKRWGFHAQIEMLGLMAHHSRLRGVLDCTIDTTYMVYCRSLLNSAELKVAKDLYHQLLVNIPTPDLSVFLVAKPKVILERIWSRNRDMEKDVALGFISDKLERVIEMYDNCLSPRLLIDYDDFSQMDYHIERVAKACFSGLISK